MGLDSIDKQNIVNMVYEQLKENIASGNWAPGSKLPSETQLQKMFNVSRVSVRSAIQRLRDLGIVVTYHGKGSFVSEKVDKIGINDFHMIMHLSEKEFLDMMVFRQTIEYKCLDLAVVNAADEDFETMEEALNNMFRFRDDYKKYSEADFNFHLAIAKASNNKVFYSVIHSIRDLYYQYLEELNRVIGVTLESIEVHLQLFRAIQNRDAEKAKEILNKAMEDNIEKIKTLKDSKK
ncbi:HTH-type transcriptional regulator LutR [Bacillus licheniformis]|uniref:FadR/GntR family transcriptional regulator n=1 Tax=Bacillus haynesii TaxID=1925021 RepID=UPI0012B77C8A|nr:FadR/GntR family transcriptional regulator [Bacillus haynesii]TWK25199.1 HTH-type transcriptional regulator LutR [Bacillus licheniformis]MCY7843758.1 FadR family transcriptional regulator [Bacillus haynesii]MCY7850469.1 FadR family transcriptional regulator [Bacillus haynesii]MCY8068121.1 FadR family transcriptional regulator [Bacillus haynesii]MCY8094045.1 FadR family transcriptional regulator [Bacillus haynesii]